MQAHPSRRDTGLPRLLERLGKLPVEVMEHDVTPHNPWLGYRRCLEDIPDGYSHLLVVQDDTVPCDNLEGALRLVARPVPVCLFLPNMPMLTRRHARTAITRGEHWIEIRHSDWVPVVAVLWPVAKIQEFLAWYGAQPPRKTPDESDDGVCGRWMRRTSQSVLATLPSLVEHPDDLRSTWRKHKRPRKALWFIGDVDPLRIEW